MSGVYLKGEETACYAFYLLLLNNRGKWSRLDMAQSAIIKCESRHLGESKRAANVFATFYFHINSLFRHKHLHTHTPIPHQQLNSLGGSWNWQRKKYMLHSTPLHTLCAVDSTYWSDLMMKIFWLSTAPPLKTLFSCNAIVVWRRQFVYTTQTEGNKRFLITNASFFSFAIKFVAIARLSGCVVYFLFWLTICGIYRIICGKFNKT